MTIDFKKLKPYIREPKVQDPPRFPKIIIPLEKEMKDSFTFQMNKMIVDVTDKLIEFKDKKLK
jgi:hypothetical protein